MQFNTKFGVSRLRPMFFWFKTFFFFPFWIALFFIFNAFIRAEKAVWNFTRTNGIAVDDCAVFVDAPALFTGIMSSDFVLCCHSFLVVCLPRHAEQVNERERGAATRVINRSFLFGVACCRPAPRHFRRSTANMEQRQKEFFRRGTIRGGI